jgi:hypothetical protein
VKVKDALIATSLVTGVASTVLGWKGITEEGSDEPTAADETGAPVEEAPPRAKIAHKATNVLGTINLIALGGILGITALLAMKSSSSAKFAVQSRFLP